ncbi:anhydro-N-acetylmuramic acid kinase [Inhella sp.]|uniref:anhydro-N-acetylmuramic acid kinase n=1 Tax=Inhella sp. TaxID=1921806 RepID=UPI0035B24B48
MSEFPPGELTIGLMSGTSLDGVDGVLARFDAGGRAEVLAHVALPMPDGLRAELLALNRPGGENELHRAALAGNALADLYTEAVAALPRGAKVVGAHGQTVRHRPELGYTLQLLNGARLAERCGLDVVADLRSRDVAAGGQGAPLVPAFHRAQFGRVDADVAVLNLGGMANLSLLPSKGVTRGFDTGPGNVLLDLWYQRCQGASYDAGGAWAAQGQVLPDLLDRLLSEPWLALPPPKSTGRDLFDAPWLEARLGPGLSAVDVQATLSEFSARTVAEALIAHMPAASELIVCGGGAYNSDLLRRLERLLPACTLLSSEVRGLPPLQVEAAAFAWLAQRFVQALPGNLPEVTGAAGLRRLGAWYPA